MRVRDGILLFLSGAIFGTAIGSIIGVNYGKYDHENMSTLPFPKPSLEEEKCVNAKMSDMASYKPRYFQSIDSSILDQIANNGGGSFTTNYHDGACYMNYTFDGILDGKSYHKEVQCKVLKLTDSHEGYFYIKYDDDLECSRDYNPGFR